MGTLGRSVSRSETLAGLEHRVNAEAGLVESGGPVNGADPVEWRTPAGTDQDDQVGAGADRRIGVGADQRRRTR
jgi:hypothetical protein